ncbi:MAG: indole-3-glycerol phosphate synthase TrpC [Chitinophagaceae bacterium]|jgi:indole-3-glycerol phosphate synthase|nr:indole-3-glycerol phosphate synthase TrpC [Chitinophagaceae bacterium]
MNILDKIVETKREEVSSAKRMFPRSMLSDRPLYHAKKYSVTGAIRSGSTTGIITEFKRRSPSKGWINEHADPVKVSSGYAANGAAAVSVLTDTTYFGGSLNDLDLVRKTIRIPILRKDFTIDSYQLHEAKAHGADIILLIAAILSPSQVKELAQEAHAIGLEVLLELHDESELQHVCIEADLVGINNRNLKNFDVNIEHSIRLQNMLPENSVRVAESGIHSAEVASRLLQSGFNCLLMGEYFMKQPDPSIAFATFVNELNTLREKGKTFFPEGKNELSV